MNLLLFHFEMDSNVTLHSYSINTLLFPVYYVVYRMYEILVELLIYSSMHAHPTTVLMPSHVTHCGYFGAWCSQIHDLLTRDVLKPPPPHIFCQHLFLHLHSLAEKKEPIECEYFIIILKKWIQHNAATPCKSVHDDLISWQYSVIENLGSSSKWPEIDACSQPCGVENYVKCRLCASG